MNPSRTPPAGEVLRLGPPASGEVIIVVDPGRAGASFAAGTETLLPRAELPVHRHLDRDEMLFIHKGQGRAVLNERAMVVLPGMTLSVPRGTWFSLRNTGTGALQFVWASSPGLEAFFRDLSRLGASPSASLDRTRDAVLSEVERTAEALQELAQRHRIEWRPAAERPRPAAAPAPGGHHRRGHRGGRRHRGGAKRGAAPGTPAPTAVGAPPEAGQRPPLRSAQREEGQPPRPEVRGQRPRRDRHRRRVKEVYMEGRWVQVEGEGPVIAPGRGSPERRGPKPDDDDPSSTPLSVPL